MEDTPLFLLIVRERLRPGTEEAYGRIETQLAAVCARLQCPHPYLALASPSAPREVWWLNAFTSTEERDGIDEAYARNEALMAQMLPLSKGKEPFVEVLTSAMTSYRHDESGGSVLRIAGARFLVIDTRPNAHIATGAVFEAPDGGRFAIARAGTRADAEALAATSGGAVILAVLPQWSFPAEDWIRADPAFWQASPAVHHR